MASWYRARHGPGVGVQPNSPRRRGVALAVAGVGGRGHLGSPSLLGQAAASVARHLGMLVSQHPAQRSPTRIVSTSVIAVLLPLGPSANDAQACGACQRF
jgi:hypothetical protein